MNKILLLIGAAFFYSGLSAQSVTFNWNGTTNYYNGTIQTWTVPACCTSITITAVGASGANSTVHSYAGGLGASLTGNIPVTPGHVLNIMVGGQGVVDIVNDGGGGGGGTFVWDNNTGLLLVAAGGGGGAGCYAGAVVGGPGADAQINNASPATLAATTISILGSCAAGGTGGALNSGGLAGVTTFGGPANSSNGGPACGGAGWGENGFNVTPGTFFYANGFGIYPRAGINAGYGGMYYGGNSSYGGYGGGGGGGFNGGGGGGGYNGGGGGNGQTTNNAGWGGGGGGSYFNAGIASSTSLGSPSSNGSVTITPNCVLPVQLLSFNAQYEKATASVNLTWSTATEVNNKLFTIEKSTDGETWVNVTTVPGSGNSNNTLYYKATDASPNSGTSYYRLKQTDYDGKETYSAVRPIDIALELSVTAYPNPTKGDIAVRYSAQSTDPININIMDISGRTLNSYTINVVEQGVNNFQINTSSLSKGMYIMKVSNPQKTSYIKFEKE